MKPDKRKSGRSELWLLTGCTACGKTELSLQCAEEVGAEIISCDSLLFYRGMDIGTAKPAAAQRARVPHHLIDVREPHEKMDVKTYAHLARRAVEDIVARGRRALVVGGSGFYLKSFLAPVADDVPVDLALRSDLEASLARDGLASLVARLEDLNPSGLGRLDIRNPRRVLRALERCLVSGRTLARLAEDFQTLPAPFSRYRVRVLELAREPEALRRRIAARTEAMISAGLIDEVRALQAAGFERNPSAATAVGYRETLAWLDEGGSVDELTRAINASTHRLVRKQRAWFRGQMPPHRALRVTPELDGRELPGVFAQLGHEDDAAGAYSGSSSIP